MWSERISNQNLRYFDIIDFNAQIKFVPLILIGKMYGFHDREGEALWDR